MKQYTGRHFEGLCPDAAVSSVISVMEGMRWHSLSPVDFHTFSSALHRLSLSLPAATSGVRELRGAGVALEHAAAGWHRSSGASAAVPTCSTTSTSTCSTLDLPLCVCSANVAACRTQVLCDLLASSAHAIGRLILAQRALARSERTCHDFTTRHLIHAGTALTIAARTLRPRPDVYGST